MNTHQDPYLFDDEAENQRRQHYNRNLSHREGHRPGHSHQSRWDEGNHFHTGPSERGSSQYGSHQQHYPYQNVHQHYANRPDSAYRQPESKINFGNRPSYSQPESRYSEKPYYTDESHFRHAPSDWDRYKADDYRYRSGHFNWNAVSVNPHGATDYDADDLDRDRRYSEGQRMFYGDEGRGHGRGFFGRITHGIKDAWNTVTHNPNYEDDNYRNNPGYHHPERPGNQSRRGYESGPRWADEHRSHEYRPAQNRYGSYRWPEDPNPNRRGQQHGYNPDPNEDW